jgi:hypothetical protein
MGKDVNSLLAKQVVPLLAGMVRSAAVEAVGDNDPVAVDEMERVMLKRLVSLLTLDPGEREVLSPRQLTSEYAERWFETITTEPGTGFAR